MSRVKSYVLGGGEGATFTAINVTGISTVAFADATTLKVSGVSTFTGTVDVNGAIDADGGANIAGGLVADTAKVSDLTDGRVVLAGTDGELRRFRKSYIQRITIRCNWYCKCFKHCYRFCIPYRC